MSPLVSVPNCPKCTSEYTYGDGSLLICPECGHEWTLDLHIKIKPPLSLLSHLSTKIINKY
ncbi:hypothetical protein KQI88_06980 [Alkaliphilus sp. MSJ-5]|uniref:Protein YjdM N-terminal domain-containing protein n=1 Tax=Alkaliphilus flagellatus TaxID=2841507 RepID=A0ABS6G466_9FIRM|nr:hypothetical protein [Alkaliphilus flagellatus]